MLNETEIKYLIFLIEKENGRIEENMEHLETESVFNNGAAAEIGKLKDNLNNNYETINKLIAMI